jgi:hypothetical protein
MTMSLLQQGGCDKQEKEKPPVDAERLDCIDSLTPTPISNSLCKPSIKV